MIKKLLMVLTVFVFVLAVNAGERLKLDDKSKMEVIDALSVNEKLHRAFFDYNGVAVEKFAKELNEKIGMISNQEIAKVLNFSRSKLLEMTAQKDRKENNQNYHLVSMALIHVIGKYDLGSKYNAYSCPMVKKKWIQNSKKISQVDNPYAPNMPHCGTQDTHY